MQVLSILSSLIMASITRAQSISSCPGNYPFQLTDAVLTPYPVIIGQNVSVSASGILAEGNQVEQGATYKIQLKLGAVTVYTENHDFCTASASAGFPCPVKTGKQTFTVSQATPPSAPAGNFKMIVYVYNADNTVISCLNGPVQLVKQQVIHELN